MMNKEIYSPTHYLIFDNKYLLQKMFAHKSWVQQYGDPPNTILFETEVNQVLHEK